MRAGGVGPEPGEDRVGREVDEELAFHLEATVEDLVAAGWTRDDAEAEARRRFPDLQGTRRACRATDRRWERRRRRAAALAGWGHDLRFALRQMRRAPAFSAAALATLVLGIGAVTTLAALAEGVLLRPLPYGEPDRLVRVWDTGPRFDGSDRVNVNPANFRDWQARTATLSGLAGFAVDDATLTADEGATLVPVARVTAELLEVLGVDPVLGRGIRRDEDADGDPAAVVVLGHGAWTRLHGADPDVLGRTVTLDGRALEVVGVAPPGLRLPGVPPSRRPDYLLPGGFGASNGRGGHWLRAVGRLAPGVSLAGARDEMAALAGALAAEHPGSNAGVEVALQPLHEAEVGESRPVVLLFLGAVGLLLLIACANVAALFLLRNLGRAREFGVRAALGAGRGRVLRQLLVETLAVAVLGAAGGASVAVVLTALLRRVPGLELPRLEGVAVSPLVAAVASGVALLASLAAVFVPALVALRRDPARGLRAGRGSAAGRRRPAELLAVAEVGLSVALLAGAGLLARSYLALGSVDPGFRPGGAAVVRLVVPESVYDDEARAALYPRILERVRALPGVVAAGAGDSPPFQRAQNSRTSYGLPGVPDPAPGEPPRMAWEEYATDGYFEALGIRLLDGRAFTGTDGRSAPPVAVVSRAFAEASWPGERAVGKRFDYNGRTWEVVGVVDGARRQALDVETGPEMFFPPAQHPFWVPSAVFVTVRTAGDPADVVAPVRRVVREIAPDVPVGLAATLESLVAETLAPARFRWLLVSAFAVAALALALLGVYAVLAYGVTLRRREIGVRMALGAGREAVRRMVLVRGLVLTGVGLASGLGLWALVGGSLGRFLYGVRPLDPATLAAVGALFLAAGAAAAWLPARRATRVDPLRTLGEE